MVTRFLIKDKKGHCFTLFGFMSSHLVVDLPGSQQSALKQIEQILKKVDTREDAFVGTCVAGALAAAAAGEYPYRNSVSTLTIGWKQHE